MARETLDSLKKHITVLQKQIAKLNEKEISKQSKSAAKSALIYLYENATSIQNVNMDTSYGTVTFKMKR